MIDPIAWDMSIGLLIGQYTINKFIFMLGIFPFFFSICLRES